MTLDVRLPMGAYFGLVGVLLTAYGAATRGAPGTAPTGMPIDLVWGVVLLVFGLAMLGLARRARAAPLAPPTPHAPRPPLQ